VGGVRSFEAVLIRLSPAVVHDSDLMVVGEGVPLIEATRSSEEPFVWLNMGSTVLFEIPNPSILAAAASVRRSSFSGSVDIDEGTLKSSFVTLLSPSSAPFTAAFTALEVIIEGWGILLMIPNLPVPAFAHCQIPLGGDICSAVL